MKKTIIISIDTTDEVSCFAPDMLAYFQACGYAAEFTTADNITVMSVTSISNQCDQSVEKPVTLPNKPAVLPDKPLPQEEPVITPDQYTVADTVANPEPISIEPPKFFCYRLKTFFDIEIDDECLEPVMYVNDIRILGDDAISIRLNGFETVFSKSAGVLHELDKSAVSARISVFLSTSSTDTVEVLIKVFIADGINTYPATVRMSQSNFNTLLQPIIDYGVNDAETY